MIGQTVAHYRIIDFIGSGSRGSVYSVEDLKRHRLASLKILSPEITRKRELTDRILAELNLVRALTHRGIPQIYDQGYSDGYHFVVMQLHDGETIDGTIRRGAAAAAWTVQTAIEVLEALAEAHSHGVLHRDLKPSNILLGSNGARLSGLGYHPEPTDEERRTLATSRDRRLHISPEHAAGRPPTMQSDIFSVASIFYRVVTGRAPFSGGDQAELRRNLMTGKPQPPSSIRGGLPASLDRALLRAMEQKLEERTPSASAFISDLSEAGRDINAMMLAKAPLARRRRRHFGTLLPTAATIVILVLVWFMWNAFRNQIP